jgi:uncharacterized protein
MENPPDPKKFFSKMIENVIKNITTKAIILFGSRANGKANFYSDFDIVVIANFTEKYHDRYKLIKKFAPSVPIDLFCYTPEEFHDMFFDFNLTAIDSIGEGIVLYDDNYIEPYKKNYNGFIKKGMHKTSCTLVLPNS